ncbi:hypothetical protein MTR67_048722 [Solanum verrucosum]|uniref:Uncharacterized protein n=1 Tax=Solanum verrucosum TaxID=315347 RepID=A0AAF0ZWS0_SOLVR|nr:hypothetical protein MTR67_048722 [Solanum verrucosum]
MEYTLVCGKPEKTKVMKAGSSRHEALKQEVIKKVKVRVDSAEDVWALKFFDFIVGANQLLFDGLTRELPLVGFAKVYGWWELLMRYECRKDKVTHIQCTKSDELMPFYGRLQLMCYKHLWDSLVANDFPPASSLSSSL